MQPLSSVRGQGGGWVTDTALKPQPPGQPGAQATPQQGSLLFLLPGVAGT